MNSIISLDNRGPADIDRYRSRIRQRVASSADLDDRTIPEELRRQRRWVLHRGKVPYQAGGSAARTNDESTWDTFPAVWAAYTQARDGRGDYARVWEGSEGQDDGAPQQQRQQQRNYDGVGYVFADDDDIVGFDLDDVIDEIGEIQDEALAVVMSLNGYAELSPSRRGLHVIVRCQDALPAMTKSAWGLEFYRRERYFTFTGLSVGAAGSARSNLPDRTDVCRAIHEHYNSEKKPVDRLLTNPKHGRYDPELVSAMIAHVPADDYGVWLRVGMGLHATGVIGGLQLWDAWSQRATSRPGTWKPGVCGEKWATFRTSGSSGSSGSSGGRIVSMGTLYFLARSHGYVGPRPDHDIVRELLAEAIELSEIEQAAIAEVRSTLRSGETGEAAAKVEAADECTDKANGLRLVARARGRHMYVQNVGWYEFVGTHWAPRDTTALRRLLLEQLGTAIRNEARDLLQRDEPDKRRAKGLAVWATKTQMVSRMLAAEKVAQAYLTESPEILAPRDPLLFPCANGTLDLTTGLLSATRADDYFPASSPIAYDAEAGCPRWRRFLDEVFLGDRALIDYVQRVAGYALTGCVNEEAFFILWGHGRNGKSTLIGVLQGLFGGMHTTLPADALMRTRHAAHAEVLASAYGMRMISASETEENAVLNTASIKNLASVDKITARRLYQNRFEFEPTHKLFLATNHPPRIYSQDEGTWRRVHRIPFRAAFAGAQQDKGLAGKLRQELPGILAWALAGCFEWQRIGLEPPPAVVQSVEEYRQEMDSLGHFFKAECVIEPGREVLLGPLYAAYKRWAEEGGEHPAGRYNFAKRLRDRGFTSGEDRKKRIVFHGLGLANLEL